MIYLGVIIHNLPAVQHLQFTHRGVDVTIATANHLLGILRALGWAIFNLVAGTVRTTTGTLLRHAVGNGDLEHVLATVGGTHLTRASVQTAIRTAGWACYTPARLTAVPGALAVFATRSNLKELARLKQRVEHIEGKTVLCLPHTTPCPQVISFIWQVELYTFPSDAHTGPSWGALFGVMSRDLGNYLIATHYIARLPSHSPITINRARLAYDASVRTRTNVSQRDGCRADAASLHAQHAPVQIGTSVRSAHQILLGRTAMVARRSLRSLAARLILGDRVRRCLRTCLLLHLALVGVDQPIATADGLLRGALYRAGPWAVARYRFALPAGRTVSAERVCIDQRWDGFWGKEKQREHYVSSDHSNDAIRPFRPATFFCQSVLLRVYDVSEIERTLKQITVQICITEVCIH